MYRISSIIVSIMSILALILFKPQFAWLMICMISLLLAFKCRLVNDKYKIAQYIPELSADAYNLYKRYSFYFIEHVTAMDITSSAVVLAKSGGILAVGGLFKGYWLGVLFGTVNWFLMSHIIKLLTPMDSPIGAFSDVVDYVMKNKYNSSSNNMATIVRNVVKEEFMNSHPSSKKIALEAVKHSMQLYYNITSKNYKLSLCQELIALCCAYFIYCFYRECTKNTNTVLDEQFYAQYINEAMIESLDQITCCLNDHNLLSERASIKQQIGEHFDDLLRGEKELNDGVIDIRNMMTKVAALTIMGTTIVKNDDNENEIMKIISGSEKSFIQSFDGCKDRT